jgi:hypothetical protein
MSFSVDRQSVFVPGIGTAEAIIRGSIMYLCMLAILRFVGRARSRNIPPIKRRRIGPEDWRLRTDTRSRRAEI